MKAENEEKSRNYVLRPEEMKPKSYAEVLKGESRPDVEKVVSMKEGYEYETGDIDIDEPGNEDKVMDEGEMGVEDTKEDDVVEDVVEEKNINIDESEDKDTLDDAALEADDVVMNEAEESRDNEADMEGKECVADEAEDNELVDEVKQEDNLNIDDKVSVDK